MPKKEPYEGTQPAAMNASAGHGTRGGPAVQACCSRALVFIRRAVLAVDDESTPVRSVSIIITRRPAARRAA
jgi:hypothetical protein